MNKKLQKQSQEIAAAFEIKDPEERQKKLKELGIVSLSQARRIMAMTKFGYTKEEQ